MGECTKAPSAIPEALGLKTITINGTRWVVAVQAGDKLGYGAGALTRRLLGERQFVRNNDYRVVRGTRLVRIARHFGFAAPTKALALLTEEALARVVASRTGDHGEYARSLVVSAQRQEMLPAPSTDRLGLAKHVFEGHAVPTLTIAGQECWVVHDVGRVLDYGRDGRTLVQMVSDKWRDEFTEGDHYVVAKGEILKGIKDLLMSITDGDRAFGPSLMLLTRAGLWLVLDKTEKPVGQRFRRWLSGEVREAAEQGRAVEKGMNGEALPPAQLALPAPVETQLSLFGETPADVARETRLMVREDHRHQEAQAAHEVAVRNLDAEAARIRTGFARDVVGWDLTDPLKRGIVRATAESIGLELKAGEA